MQPPFASLRTPSHTLRELCVSSAIEYRGRGAFDATKSNTMNRVREIRMISLPPALPRARNCEFGAARTRSCGAFHPPLSFFLLSFFLAGTLTPFGTDGRAYYTKPIRRGSPPFSQLCLFIARVYVPRGFTTPLYSYANAGLSAGLVTPPMVFGILGRSLMTP